MKRILIIIAGFLVIAILGYGLLRTPEPAAQQAEAGNTVGKAATAFTLRDINGNTVTVDKGEKAAVINFWATWCPPCREEMPELQQFYQANGQRVNFYAVNIQESTDKIREFFIKHRYEMPVLMDEDASTARLFQITAIPTTIVIDRNGSIKYRKTGGVTKSELEGVLKGL